MVSIYIVQKCIRMKVKFLGTGGSVGIPEIGCQCKVCNSKDPRDKRHRASALISVAGKRILIDCGPDFKEQILKEPFSKLDAVLLTHEHYDHVAGIDDLRAFGKFGDVELYANKLTGEALKRRIPYCFEEHKYPGVPNINLNIVENTFFVGSVEIEPIIVMHYRLPIFGYRIDNFAYLTDVKEIPETEYDKLKGLDVLVVSALRHQEHVSHQTIEEAQKVIKKIAPNETYLIHMSHSLGLHAEEDAKLPSNIHLAYDGLELTL